LLKLGKCAVLGAQDTSYKRKDSLSIAKSKTFVLLDAGLPNGNAGPPMLNFNSAMAAKKQDYIAKAIGPRLGVLCGFRIEAASFQSIL
jgi:hypothetical protein